MIFRNIRLTAFTVAVGLCLLLFVAAGGCGGTRSPSGPRVVAVPDPAPLEVGRDPRIVARLENPAAANVTVYRADAGAPRREDVRLAPGAWIVPESAFIPPEKSNAR